MRPAAKGKKGAKGAEVVRAPVDPTADLRSIQSVTEILSGVKQLRQFYQLERDKVQQYWSITQKELENARSQLLNADEELESMERRHQVELKVYKQKVRHLKFEHSLQVKEVRGLSDQELAALSEAHHKRMEQLRQEKADLYKQISRDLERYDETFHRECETHRDMLANIKRPNYQQHLRDVQQRYETRLATLREELDLRRRAEIHEVEERTNEHINELIRLHEAKFADMKNYYNQITGNNLDLIRSLKEEIANMKRNDEHNENLMYDIEKENDNLSEPLEAAKRDVAELQQKLHNYEKDKMSLRHTRSRLHSLNAEYSQLAREHEELQRKYHEVSAEREKLKSTFESTLCSAMDVCEQRTATLQQRLVEALSKVEERDAHLQNVLAAVNLEPATLEHISRELEDALEMKNRNIKDLHFELKKIERQHRDILAEYERRCQASSLPLLNLNELA